MNKYKKDKSSDLMMGCFNKQNDIESIIPLTRHSNMKEQDVKNFNPTFKEWCDKHKSTGTI